LPPPSPGCESGGDEQAFNLAISSLPPRTGETSRARVRRPNLEIDLLTPHEDNRAACSLLRRKAKSRLASLAVKPAPIAAAALGASGGVLAHADAAPKGTWRWLGTQTLLFHRRSRQDR